MVHLQAEKIAGAAMIALLDTLAARHPAVSAIKVVLDNASYSHSVVVKSYPARVHCRIQPVFLPPYAPNLNLIERLWWFLRKTASWGEHYPTLADFKAVIDGFFRDLGSYREQLTSLITGHLRYSIAPKSQLQRHSGMSRHAEVRSERVSSPIQVRATSYARGFWPVSPADSPQDVAAAAPAWPEAPAA